MKVPQGANYVKITLNPDCFEYNLVYQALITSANPNQNAPQQNFNNLKIEKIYNPQVFDRFTSELKRTLLKNPRQKIQDMVKFLFHGTSMTDVAKIYDS